MLNRRSFVQSLGASAVGLLALEEGAGTLAAAQLSGAAQNGQATATAPQARAAMSGLIRIGSNENPYGPALSVLEAVTSSAKEGNRYPGPVQQKLIDAIAGQFRIAADHVMLSGGSGDILNAVVRAFTSKTKALVSGLPSYEQPVRTAQALGNLVKEVPLDADLRLDLAAMGAKSLGAGLVYVCNPNNPTSTSVPLKDIGGLIEKVVKASPTTTILVDEAYFEYSDLPGFDTAAPYVMKYPQVIVARTFSKIHAMAGMRAGYALAQPKTIALIRAYHSSSGMSVMTMAAATASLLDAANLEKNRTANRDVRRLTADAFRSAGFRVAQSDANFVFVEIKRDSRGFQDACRQQGVAVGRAFPPMTTWARISIGTQAEMETALPVFMKVLSAPPGTQTASYDDLDSLPSELT
jgi:histidinol-phosphate aminotransferase